MKGRLIFVLGGAKSGKSSFAEEKAEELGKRVVYVATAPYLDEEMKRVIARHKNHRNKKWKTVEITKGLSEKIISLSKECDVLLIDCLTLYLANMLCDASYKMKEKECEKRELQIISEIESLIANAKRCKAKVIMISNEVGFGIHPETRLGRFYRNVLGRVNQLVAKEVDEFYFVLAGFPIEIKRLKEAVD